MTYNAPEIHEVGLAAEVIQGVPSGEGNDLGEFYPPAFTLEDFDE